jgi:hypothetical protein
MRTFEVERQQLSILGSSVLFAAPLPQVPLPDTDLSGTKKSFPQLLPPA